MNRRIKHLLFLTLFLYSSARVHAQRFPVQATIQILPPYTPYLSDYVSPGQDRIRITLVLLDQREPSLQVKLRLQIEGQGYSFKSGANATSSPITLQANVPLTLTNADLRPYISPTTSIIQSLRNTSAQGSKLKEGFYQFCVEVYPFIRDETPISALACTSAFLQELDPPIIVAPSFEVIPTSPQTLMIAWQTQHFGGFPVDYELSIYEKVNALSDQAIVDFTAPLFRITTPGLAYIWRADDPPLVIGKTYLLRVKVRDPLNRNLFKNNGYSTIHFFEYGRPCAPPVITEAKLYADGHAHIAWTSLVNHDDQVIRYRYHDESDWTTQKLSLESRASSNDHQYAIPIRKSSGPLSIQIGSSCYHTIAVESEIAQIKLDRKSLPRGFYSCGMVSSEDEIPVESDLITLRENDTITANGYMVIIKSIDGSGTSGTCGVAIPMIKNAIVWGEYRNLKVNQEYVMLSGDIKLQSAGVQLLSDRYLDLLDGLIESLETGRDIMTEATFQSAVEYLRPYLGLFLNDSLSDELQQAIDDLANATDDAATQKAQERLIEVLKEITAQIKLLYDAPYQILFDKTIDQRYGFDRYDKVQYAPLESKYEKLSIAKKEYHVPFKSIAVGQRDYILATPDGEPSPGQEIYFITNDSVEVDATLSGGSYKLHLPPFPAKGEYTLYAVIRSTDPTDSLTDENIAGQCKIIVYEPQIKSVVLVPVNGASAPSAATVSTELNKIYGQAVTEWRVSIGANLDVPAYDNKLDSIKTGLLATYTDEMRDIIRTYEAQRTGDTNTYHLFIVAASAEIGLQGFMPKKRNFGFITNSDAITIAHELGHGPFRLAHTWEDYPALRERTDNLMDYSGGRALLHYQWELIQHPEPMVGWMQDDEEAMSISDIWKFFRQCYDDYKNQKEGFVPRCAWDHDYNTPYTLLDFALSAGIIDAFIATGGDIINVATFITCFNLLDPARVWSKECIDSRSVAYDVVNQVAEIFGSKTKRESALLNIKKVFADYVDETAAINNQGRYNQGKLVFNVASSFIGVGELKALSSGAKLNTVLTKSMSEFAALPKSIGRLFWSAGEKSGAFLRQSANTAALIYRLNTTEIKLADLSQNQVFTNFIKWTDEGTVLEKIEDVKYLDKTGKEVFGDLEVIRENGGDIGIRKGIEKVLRFIARTSIELKSHLANLKNIPPGKTYSGDFYKSVSKNAELNYNAKPEIISQYSIEEAWGRYDIQGESGMYFSNSFNGNQTEMSHYGEWSSYSTYEFKNVKIDNILDLTDDAVRQLLGTEFDKLVLEMGNKTQAYEFTNVIGTWARENKYKGLIVPGARGGKVYSNIVVFNQSDLNSALNEIHPVKLK